MEQRSGEPGACGDGSSLWQSASLHLQPSLGTVMGMFPRNTSDMHAVEGDNNCDSDLMNAYAGASASSTAGDRCPVDQMIPCTIEGTCYSSRSNHACHYFNCSTLTINNHSHHCNQAHSSIPFKPIAVFAYSVDQNVLVCTNVPCLCTVVQDV